MIDGDNSLGGFLNAQTYAETRKAVGLAQTLNPDSYSSREFYELEKSLLWQKSWVCVGYTSQVAMPGAALTATVADQPIFVVRDHGGVLRAFYNVCRHRGSLLLESDGVYKHIRCPYHRWTYACNGALEGMPLIKAERDMQNFCKGDYGLLPINVDVWGCFVFINLDKNPLCTLTEWLGDLPMRLGEHRLAELHMIRRERFEVKANWKLVAENFLEYYHVPFIHPDLNRVAKGNDHHRYQGSGMYMGFWTKPLTKDPTSPMDRLPDVPGLGDVAKEAGFWIHIFPNISLFLLPSHLYTLLLTPNGPEMTIEHTDFLVHQSVADERGLGFAHQAATTPANAARPASPAELNETLDAVFTYWDGVNREDFTAVEKVQRGMAAKAYRGGRFVARYEEPLHRFQNMVIDKMVGTHRIPPGDFDTPSVPAPDTTEVLASD